MKRMKALPSLMWADVDGEGCVEVYSKEEIKDKITSKEWQDIANIEKESNLADWSVIGYAKAYHPTLNNQYIQVYDNDVISIDEDEKE